MILVKSGSAWGRGCGAIPIYLKKGPKKYPNFSSIYTNLKGTQYTFYPKLAVSKQMIYRIPQFQHEDTAYSIYETPVYRIPKILTDPVKCTRRVHRRLVGYELVQHGSIL